jgi:hypothetical protein
MNHFDLAIKQIGEKQQQIQDAVCSNQITSYEEYKYLCGEIHGLLIAQGYLLDLKDQMEHYNDND